MLRNRNPRPSAAQRTGEIGLSLLSSTMLFFSGWLGGQLSYRFGVAVEPPAAPYRILDLAPVARLTEKMEVKDGSVRVPAESVWSGPEIPSVPLPYTIEGRRAA
jgi:hypothetical protein